MIKSLKFFFAGLFLLCLNGTSIQGQTLTFCESVNKYGKAINPADTFDVAQEGSMLTVLVKPGHSLNTTLVKYEIYYVDDTAAIYNNTETKEVQGNWLFCWIHLFFKDEGRYRIRALAEDNSLLGTGEVYIKLDKK